MQLTAKLIKVLPLQSGTSKNGEWKRQDIIVETDGRYPKNICFSIWGDKIDNNQFKIGNTLKIDFDIESREYNNKWYTNLKAWNIKSLPQVSDEVPEQIENMENIDLNAKDEDDVLPF